MNATITYGPLRDLDALVAALHASFSNIEYTGSHEDFPDEHDHKKGLINEWKSFAIPTSQGPIDCKLHPRQVRFQSTAKPDPDAWRRVVEFCHLHREPPGEVSIVLLKLAKPDPDYDPLATLEELKTRFPQIIVDPEEQFALALEHAQKRNASEKILRGYQRDAARMGPAYACQIPTSHTPAKGTVRRRDMTFIFHGVVDENVWNSILEFFHAQRGELEILY